MGDAMEAALREKAEWVVQRVVEAYGRPNWLPSLDPLSELVATILSQHTSDANSHRAFASLRSRFRTWEEVRETDSAAIASAIRSGGLAEVKAPRIKAMLDHVARAQPEGDEAPLSLAFLNDLPLEEARRWLRAVPGVGPKTAACVLMFALGKPALPVDTHVYRVSRRLGLIGAKVSADAAHAELEKLVPAQDVYTFHVDTVIHGRRVCRAPVPTCEVCNLRERCDYYKDGVSHSSRSASRWAL